MSTPSNAKTPEPLRDDLVVMLERAAETRQLLDGHRLRLQHNLDEQPIVALLYTHLELMVSFISVLGKRVQKLEAHQQQSLDAMGRFTQAASRYTEQQTGRDRRLLHQVTELIAEVMRTRDEDVYKLIEEALRTRDADADASASASASAAAATVTTTE